MARTKAKSLQENEASEWIHECCEVVSDPVIVRGEKGKSFRISNPERKLVQVWRVDNCLAGEGQKKCDYFVVCDGICYMFELKGRDFSRAVSQIISSLPLVDVHCPACKPEGWVVSSRKRGNYEYLRVMKERKRELNDLELRIQRAAEVCKMSV